MKMLTEKKSVRRLLSLEHSQVSKSYILVQAGKATNSHILMFVIYVYFVTRKQHSIARKEKVDQTFTFYLMALSRISYFNIYVIELVNYLSGQLPMLHF